MEDVDQFLIDPELLLWRKPWCVWLNHQFACLGEEGRIDLPSRYPLLFGGVRWSPR